MTRNVQPFFHGIFGFLYFSPPTWTPTSHSKIKLQSPAICRAFSTPRSVDPAAAAAAVPRLQHTCVAATPTRARAQHIECGLLMHQKCSFEKNQNNWRILAQTVCLSIVSFSILKKMCEETNRAVYRCSRDYIDPNTPKFIGAKRYVKEGLSKDDMSYVWKTEAHDGKIKGPVWDDTIIETDKKGKPALSGLIAGMKAMAWNLFIMLLIKLGIGRMSTRVSRRRFSILSFKALTNAFLQSVKEHTILLLPRKVTAILMDPAMRIPPAIPINQQALRSVKQPTTNWL
jgi:hypothetical protein